MKHTPFDGSNPLFRIGVKPLDLANWIEVDERLDFYLEEKRRLEEAHPGKVFGSEIGSEAAQREVLDFLVDFLPARFPETYQLDGNAMHVNGRSVALDSGLPPLKIAGHLVQEDLAIMHRDETGWRLVAASLSFPSSWSLAEKFGKPLQVIHATVPGFAEGTRNADLITRMFDNLKPDMPVWRMNWSVYDNDRLFHGWKKGDPDAPTGYGDNASEPRFIRVEYQTLRKLPLSGDILFTIRIHLNPLKLLETMEEGSELARGFITSLEMLDADQLAYKNLTAGRDRLVERLRVIVEGVPAS